MKILQFLFFTAYFALSLAEVRAASARDTAREKRVKPLLMPLLLAFYAAGVSAGEGTAAEPLLAAGLLFGFLGDTVLLYPRGFVPGLVFFLLGHVMYIPLFLSRSALPGFLKLTPVFLVWIIIALVFAPRLLPKVPRELKLPVLLYMAVILVMSASAYLRFITSASPSSALCLAGSLLFLLSDTQLAFVLFGERKPRGVMETYLAAQFLIAVSFL